jgi:segregation and condensation protein B
MAEDKEQTGEEKVELHISGDDAGLPAFRDLGAEEMARYRGLIEAVLFVATEPQTVAMIARTINLDRVNTRILADSLVDDFAERDGGISLREIAGGYQFVTSDRYSEEMREILQTSKREKLSRSVMETLAIISYRQPITLPEIEDVRGVASRPHVVTLLAKRLIKPQGTRPVPGRPTLYVTTKTFLQHFALNSLAELPPLEELKELKFDEIE